jgi:hypothetical protein
MPAEICRRCNTVEECYEFMLAYAAQGVSSGDGSQSGGRIREVLQQAVDALSGLADACVAAVNADAHSSQQRNTSRSWPFSIAMRTTLYAPSNWCWRNQQSVPS